LPAFWRIDARTLAMKFLLAIAALFLVWPLSGAHAQRPLRCDIGPVHRTFGGTPWLVYSCEDGKSLAVITEAGSVAAPFYFVLAWRDGGYRISGEGNGSEDASNAAGRDLEALSANDIAALIAETRAVVSEASR